MTSSQRMRNHAMKKENKFKNNLGVRTNTVFNYE